MESKSERGCRRESGSLLVMGKGEGIPAGSGSPDPPGQGNSDQIPASNAAGSSWGCSYQPHHVLSHDPQSCHPPLKGLGDQRMGVPPEQAWGT